MNKTDFEIELVNITKDFRGNYFKNYFFNLIEGLEYGKDYLIYCNEKHERIIIESLNFLNETNHKNLRDFSLKELSSDFSGYISINRPFESSYEGKNKYYSLNYVKISNKGKHNYAPIYLKFKDEKNFILVKEMYEKCSELVRDIQRGDDKLRHVLKNFETIDKFLDFIKDNEAYKNIYNHFRGED